MLKYEVFLLLLVSRFGVLFGGVHGQSCVESNKTNLDNIEAQFRLLENEIATLTDAMQSAAWSILNFKAALSQLKMTMRTVATEEGLANGSPHWNSTSCETISNSSCTNINMAGQLARYFKEHKIVEIKFSNGSSLISGCNEIIDREPQEPTNVRVVKSCREAQGTGTYILNNNGNVNESFPVQCDADYIAGGWVVLQHRFIGTLDFYRNWTEYKEGFGDLGGEFWLGNEKIYQVIHFILTDWDDRTAVAKYSSFQIGSEEQKYVLKSVGIYSGTAGDSISRGLNSKFSTKDQDNDSYSDNCAILYHGAWWYEQCHLANLNGKYARGTVSEYATSMCWNSFMGYYYGLKTSKILIRV
ncbi:microfibril-associated glycoprotein 4-like isoform X2 [Malaya genurostris]|uniref:microfibril-associated glycoprotein 4-like isoform X2 n=1 Tax=Malaya genurostris TaxID=325434 RepID=UPI0026F3965C|nr:microfibril-associated glycoprotein 4-like isoform X2 [Malaya genurostris]